MLKSPAEQESPSCTLSWEGKGMLYLVLRLVLDHQGLLLIPSVVCLL